MSREGVSKGVVMMRRMSTLALVGAVVVGLLAPAMSASAKEGDVIRRGSCSGPSEWKLKLSPENGRIEVEFEVDSNKVGQTWRVRLFHNGVRFFAGLRTTQAPSGSFEVRRVVNNLAGDDHIRGRARNLKTDELCVGRATF
jgi:hypothetical protein